MYTSDWLMHGHSSPGFIKQKDGLASSASLDLNLLLLLEIKWQLLNSSIQ